MTATFTDTDGNYSEHGGSDGPVSPAAAASATAVSDNAASTSTGGTLVFTATVSRSRRHPRRHRRLERL